MANIRTVSFVLGLLAATGSLAVAQPSQAPARLFDTTQAKPVEQPAGRAGAQAATQPPAPVSDIDARSTREQLRQVLQRYPPDLGRILRMDPTLLQSPTYLAQYPALAQFLAAHPGIVHNPNFYFDFVRDNYDWNEPPDARTESVRMWRNMMEAIGVFCIFVHHLPLSVLAGADVHRLSPLAAHLEDSDGGPQQAARSLCQHRRSHDLGADPGGSPLSRIRADSARSRNARRDGPVRPHSARRFRPAR